VRGKDFKSSGEKLYSRRWHEKIADRAMQQQCLLYVAIVLIFVAQFASIASSSSVQLISADGVCRSSSQIQTHLSSSSVPTSCPLISCVNCGLPNGHTIVNSLLDTKYDGNDIGWLNGSFFFFFFFPRNLQMEFPITHNIRTTPHNPY